jgi:hypothetical protein
MAGVGLLLTLILTEGRAMAECSGAVLQSAAYAALSGRRALAIIEDALSQHGDRVAVSLTQFLARGLCKSATRYGVRQLQQLGFVTIGQGPRQIHLFARADGWRELDADAAQRLMKLVAPRARSKPPQRVMMRPEKPVEQPRAMQ